MLDVPTFVLHQGPSDLVNMLQEQLLLDDAEELSEVVHQVLPVGLTDHVALALRHSSVYEDLPLVEADFEGADHGLAVETEAELLRFVDLVTNIVIACIDEQNLIDFVQFVVDGLSCRYLYGFKLL